VFGIGAMSATPASAASFPKPLLKLVAKEGGKELVKNACKDYCGGLMGKIIPEGKPAYEWSNNSYEAWEKKAYEDFDKQARGISKNAPDRQIRLQKIAESVYSKYVGYWKKLDAVSLFEFTTAYRGEDGKVPDGAYMVGGAQFGPPDRDRLGYGMEDAVQKRRDAKDAVKSMQNGLLERAGLKPVENGGFWTPADHLQDTKSGRTYWEWVPTKETGGAGTIGLTGTPLSVGIGGNSGYLLTRFINSPQDAQQFLDLYRLGRNLANKPASSEAAHNVDERASVYEGVLSKLVSSSTDEPFKDPNPGPPSLVSSTPADLSGVRPAPGSTDQPQQGGADSQVRKKREAGFGAGTDHEQPAPASNGMEHPVEGARQDEVPTRGDAHTAPHVQEAGTDADTVSGSGGATSQADPKDNGTTPIQTAPPLQAPTDVPQPGNPPTDANWQLSSLPSGENPAPTPVPSGPQALPPVTADGQQNGPSASANPNAEGASGWRGGATNWAQVLTGGGGTEGPA